MDFFLIFSWLTGFVVDRDWVYGGGSMVDGG